MENYTVTVLLHNGKTEYFECEAVSHFDARQQADWAYVREGAAISVEKED